jgi:hypothetical protein
LGSSVLTDPLVQEIISVIHYLPCFGGGLSLCLFTGISALLVYFFALPPFSGAGCVPPTPVVCALLQSLFVFQFCRAVVLDAAL